MQSRNPTQLAPVWGDLFERDDEHYENNIEGLGGFTSILYVDRIKSVVMAEVCMDAHPFEIIKILNLETCETCKNTCALLCLASGN